MKYVLACSWLFAIPTWSVFYTLQSEGMLENCYSTDHCVKSEATCVYPSEEDAISTARQKLENFEDIYLCSFLRLSSANQTTIHRDSKTCYNTTISAYFRCSGSW